MTDNEKDSADKGFDYRKKESNKDKVSSRIPPSDQNIHEELMGLLKEDEKQYVDEWIEDINFEVDDCCINVNDYLISRREDPPSETMSKVSIVAKYFNRSVHDESLTEG